MKKNRKRLIFFNLILISIMIVGISGCSPLTQTDLPPTQANSPLAPTQAPATQTNLPPTQTSVPAITMTGPVQSDVTVYPTPRRDLTPTPNPTSAAWPEFSSEFIYQEDEVAFAGTLHFAFRYPPDWYLYPSKVKKVAPGGGGRIYLQSFEWFGNDPEYSPWPAEKAVRLTFYALPCNITEQGCPVELSDLAAEYPGNQEIIYHDIDGWTTWTTFLFVNGFRFMLQAYMPGTPEENAELIQILEEILATVRLW